VKKTTELALDSGLLRQRYKTLLQLAGFLQEDAFRLFCLMGRLSSTPAAPVLEVGVFCGRSLAALALAFPDAEAVGVDPMFEELDNEYALEGEGEYLAQAAGHASPERRLAVLSEVLKALETDGETGIASRIRIERITQTQFLGSPAADRANQLVHLDGEHTYAAVKEALDHLPRLLLPGGWLVMDDFSNPGFPEISEAIHRHIHFRDELLPVVYGFNKGVFLWRATATHLSDVLENMDGAWRTTNYLVRRMTDGSMVIDRKTPAPATETRRTLRQRVARKLRRLAGIVES